MAVNATKYVFVTGGVLSGLGKGITAASIGNLLKARGLKVNLQKCDPYLNVDAGILNPREHGECFVTKDGAETDLDLGHYERFVDEEMTSASSLMSGRVLKKLIEDERAGKFEGDDVQIIPHLTGAIQDWITDAGAGFDVHIVEIGGTVGDYESLSFVEAIREMGMRVGLENCLYVHVVYLPYLNASHETKTKPAQNSVRDLRGLGITPDILVCRSEQPSSEAAINKLSLFSGVPVDSIAALPNAKSIYEVPITLEEGGIGEVITKKLGFNTPKPDFSEWQAVVDMATAKYDKTLKIAFVAKYMDNTDTYMSVFEALRSAAWHNGVNIDIHWIDASKFDEDGLDISNEIKDYDGIVVPGGFGQRGLEGKIKAAQYALKAKKPYLGLCLGLQMAVIAAARNAGIKDANTFELDNDGKNLVIITMNGQEDKLMTGGTMRLGNYDCKIEPSSLAARVYKSTEIVERHRHRGECNNKYRDDYESWGIKATGLNPENNLVEIIEGIGHPFFLASQFHPEFKSRPNRPHPMFNGFIEVILDQ
ncbi:MAG TPA: CTP synthase [Candidatus Saccharimonadales bacterium]|nr:CTP synthase [Candidatus Saccharimonadales bacterium]